MGTITSSGFLRASLKRALFGNVTQSISAVSFRIEGNEIYLSFFFEGVISTDDKEKVSIIETEIMADFDERYVFNTSLLRQTSPLNMSNINEEIVYLKKS